MREVLYQVKIRMLMDENIFCLSCCCCHLWAWMFPSSGFIFTSSTDREKGLFWFVGFFVWFDFCGFGFCLWFGFFYLCCKLQFYSLFFFTSVLRRTVTLLTQLAKEMASHAALETQVNDATEAAKKYMAENERLQEVSLSFFSNFLTQQVVSAM